MAFSTLTPVLRLLLPAFRTLTGPHSGSYTAESA